MEGRVLPDADPDHMAAAVDKGSDDVCRCCRGRESVVGVGAPMPQTRLNFLSGSRQTGLYMITADHEDR